MKRGWIPFFLLIFILMHVPLSAQNTGDITRLKQLGFSFPEKPMYPPPLMVYSNEAPVQLTRQNKVTVLYFWSSLIPSSLTDLPLLDSLKKSMEDQNILFAPVNLNEPRSRVLMIAETLRLSMNMYCYPEREALSPYILKSVPAAYILDSRGRLVASKQGNASWGDPDVRRSLEELVGAEP